MKSAAASPLVSVLMPAYNHEPYVRTAVESVLGQSHGDLELIAIDDASRDGTWAVLEGFADPRLRISRHAENRGAHATLNEALGLARGEYVAVLNSDDMFHPNRLAASLGRFGARPELAAVFSRYEFLDAEGRVVRDADSIAADFPDVRAALGAAANGLEGRELAVLGLLARNHFHTSSNLVCRRAALERLGGFRDFRYVHDYDLFLRLCADQPVEMLPEVLLGYRFHGGNTLAESAAASVTETAAMLAEFLLTHELAVLRRDHAGFMPALDFLLESFRAYGADRLVLMLVLTEAGGGRAPSGPEPLFRELAGSETIRGRVAGWLETDRTVENLRWQEAQTTKWWEESERRGHQLEAMKAERGRIGDELWQANQDRAYAQRQIDWLDGRIGELESAINEADARHAALWARHAALQDRYDRSLEARARRILHRLRESLIGIRKGSQR